jgi:hypothetical protein
MAGVYRNTGARWRRPDGTVIESGAEFVPTDEERVRKAHKLRLVGQSDGPAPTAQKLRRRPDVSDYETENGWYMVGGKNVHGRAAAEDALEELLGDEQRQIEANRLDVR